MIPQDDFELPENGLGAPPYHPLPDRTFPVQSAPKVTSVYATSTPLDTKGPPAKKWRLVYREVKGVGGSRFFAKTWIRGTLSITLLVLARCLILSVQTRTRFLRHNNGRRSPFPNRLAHAIGPRKKGWR
jgi:hypothetical protein